MLYKYYLGMFVNFNRYVINVCICFYKVFDDYVVFYRYYKVQIFFYNCIYFSFV